MAAADGYGTFLGCCRGQRSLEAGTYREKVSGQFIDERSSQVVYISIYMF